MPYRLLKGVAKNHSFFGRKVILDEMDKVLLPPAQRGQSSLNNSLQCFAICGLGGVGKTQVAIEYVFSRQSHFDAIFWIEADEGTKIDEVFGNIAAQLGYNDDSDKDRVISRSLVLEWLSNPLKRPDSSNGVVPSDSPDATWLMVFNNVDDLELLTSYWPIGASGSILMTSRDPLAKNDCSGVDLESFLTTDAAAFLRLKLKLDDSPENLRESITLAERFGGLPLAISQIAALIARWEMTLKEFLEFYEKETSKVAVAKDNPAFLRDNYYRHSLFTVWAFETLNSQALTILQIISFLNPNRIQEYLFADTVPENAPSNFPSDATEYILARKELTKVSLVRRIKEDNELIVHRLVQDVVQTHMTSTVATDTFALAVSLIIKAWPTGFMQFDHDMTTWERSEELLQHILKLHHAYQNHPSWTHSLHTMREFAKLLLFAGW